VRRSTLFGNEKKILAEYGYQTVPQVGVAGFRIDLGVCHPQSANEYI